MKKDYLKIVNNYGISDQELIEEQKFKNKRQLERMEEKINE